ncbi:tRNA-dihydrouridine synthase [Candidatus Vondammii sp. HM_W22]|uniref:tRNA-dihydrouridine synthase n=1 Tax=Candidatus Vondammii sp. HM_W22 TaxID=2687299 RepID=UPI001F13587C|nr:tRNA-dihydrouridine synthase [Candidatus Vondammii sp. HM_W22]
MKHRPQIWIKKILTGHLGNLYNFYIEQKRTIARKHTAWYSKTQPGGAQFRKQINETDTADQQTTMIEIFFDHLATTKELAT